MAMAISGSGLLRVVSRPSFTGISHTGCRVVPGIAGLSTASARHASSAAPGGSPPASSSAQADAPAAASGAAVAAAPSPLRALGLGAVAVGACGALYAWQSSSAEKVPANSQAPPASSPAPAVSKPAPPVSSPAPAVSKPAPPVSSPAPAVSKPAPPESSPAPPVSSPAPPVTEATLESKAGAPVQAKASAPAPPPAPVEDPQLVIAADMAAKAARFTLAAADAARLAAISGREAARAALAEAVQSKDVAAIEAALAAAEKASLGRCAEVDFAQSFMRPTEIMRAAVSGATLSTVRVEELKGLSATEAATAELAACEGLAAEQLKERVVELTRHLATARLYARERMEETLATHLEAAEVASLQSLEQGLTQLKARHDAKSQEDLAALEVSLRYRHEQVVADARNRACQETSNALAAEQVAQDAAREDAVAEERSGSLSEVISSGTGLSAIEDILKEEAAVIERIRTYNNVACAVLSLEDAILAGRNGEAELQALQRAASKEDPFVEGILAALPPSCLHLCSKKTVPTEPLLKHHLNDRLNDLTTVALLPPGGGLLAEVVARIFRKFYILDCDAAPDLCSDSQVSANLRAISRAKSVIKDDGSLAQVLNALEGSLQGACQACAAGWLPEMRDALLLKQALWAIKARVQCHTATLHEE